MSTNPKALEVILSAMRLAHATATNRLTANLDCMLTEMTKVNSVSARRIALDHIHTTLADVREEVGQGKINFRTVVRLRTTMVHLRFVRQPSESEHTENPLYNVTIWLAEAIGAAAEIARLHDLLEGAKLLEESE